MDLGTCIRPLAPHTSWLTTEGSILNLPEISWHVQAKAADERQPLLFTGPFSQLVPLQLCQQQYLEGLYMDAHLLFFLQ